MPQTYRDTDDPRQALRDLLAFSSRDWGAVKGDAWLWGIVFGWDCDDTEDDKGDAMTEVAAQHGWDSDDIGRLRRLHANFERLTLPSSPKPDDPTCTHGSYYIDDEGWRHCLTCSDVRPESSVPS